MISAQCSLGLSDDELARWRDEDLSPARMAQLRAHIATCAGCQRRVAAYEEIGSGLRSLTPPPLDVERLMANLRAAMPAATTTSPAPTVPGMALMPERYSWHSLRSWQRLSGMAGLAAVVVISLLAGYLFVNHGRPAPAKVSAPPLTSADLPPRTAVIDMSSATDGWAFTSKALNGDGPVVALHYAAGKWTRVQTEVQGRIHALKMLSPTDGWLLSTARIYHYDGHSWQAVTVPGPGWRLDTDYGAIAAPSPSSIWISTDGKTSADGPNGQPGMLHYDGNTWTRQALPIPDLLWNNSYTVLKISMASVDEGWAIASATVEWMPLGVLLHYTHGVWKVDSTYRGVDFYTVSLASASDGWIGGSYVMTTLRDNGSAETFSPLLWRLSNGHWRSQPIPGGYKPPLDGQVWSIRMLSPTTGWMIAEIRPAHETNTNTRPLFWLRNGQWVQVPDATIPDDLSEYFAAAFVSANEFWAVGRFGISHYSNGQWKLVVP